MGGARVIADAPGRQTFPVLDQPGSKIDRPDAGRRPDASIFSTSKSKPVRNSLPG
jgi:hypothetical protein